MSLPELFPGTSFYYSTLEVWAHKVLDFFCLRKKGHMNVHQRGEQVTHHCCSSEIFRAHEMEAQGDILSSQAWNQRGHNDTDPRALGCSHALGAGGVSSNWMWSTEGIGMHLTGEIRGVTQEKMVSDRWSECQCKGSLLMASSVS